MNDADLQNLKLEVSGPAYAGKEDIEIAALLNQPGNTTGSKKAPVRNIHKYMIAKGLWAALKSAAATNITADGVLDIIGSNNFVEIDLFDPVSEAMLATLVGDGILSVAQKTEMQAMSLVVLTTAEALLGQGVSVHHLDVAHARGRG